jgi:hypothetical protein
VNLVAHGVRYADAAGLGQRLQPGRDIHPVAKDVASVNNDVAEIDSDAKSDPPIVRHIPVAVEHAALNLCGAAHRVDDAAEFHQHPVARRLDDAAAMFGDLRVDQFPSMRFQPGQRALLIRPHQTRIARHIGGKDRDQAAVRARAFVCGAR